MIMMMIWMNESLEYETEKKTKMKGNKINK